MLWMDAIFVLLGCIRQLHSLASWSAVMRQFSCWPQQPVYQLG